MYYDGNSARFRGGDPQGEPPLELTEVRWDAKIMVNNHLKPSVLINPLFGICPCR